MGLYVDDDGVTRISILSNVNEHIPELKFDMGDTLDDDNYNYSFDDSVLGKNRIVVRGKTFDDGLSASVAKRAEQLGLRGQEFSDYVELGIAPSVKSKRDNALSALTPPMEDKTFENPISPTSADSLLEVIKEGSNSANDVAVEHLDAVNYLISLEQNKNAILKEANEIAIEKNRILELGQKSSDGFNQLMLDNSTAMTQFLGYLPSLIEVIKLSSDRAIELQNISNSHAMQKNVNDAYEFNHDKDMKKVNSTSLTAMSSELSKHTLALDKSATAHHDVVEPIKKQGDLAHEKKLDIDDENSAEGIGILEEISDFFADTYKEVSDEFINDFDIFEYVLKTRITEVR